ncbi:helix-turn-helix transcriptional regulator [Balneolaceae bacterium ANBcel3]|nr:helix-turn-helix transcriptional regulator [Balneolaceae bacterium ANBcel3]
MSTSFTDTFEKVFFEKMTLLQQQIAPPDYSQTDYLKAIAKAYDAIENRPTYILDLFASDFFFVSERYLSLLGFRKKTRLDFNFFMDTLYPGDYWITTDATFDFLTFLETKPVMDRLNFKLVTDFRFRMPTGEYVRILEQMILLQTDKRGKPWLVMAICDLSPNQNLSTPSSGKIISAVDGAMVKAIGDCRLQNPSQNLTKREKQILLLISKGYASKQIADKLSISIHTVNNHRRNILIKTGCQNTFEAIKYVAGGFLGEGENE